MTSKTAQLNELIEITRDGKKFYEHARQEVKNIGLKALFTDMAHAKAEVIQALSVKVIANNEQPATGGTLMGKMRQVYADARASLSSDEDAAYVAQLEEAEDRILHAFRDVLENADADVRALLVLEMPKVRACHDRMRTVKQSVK